MTRGATLSLALLAACALGRAERTAGSADGWAERFAAERAIAARDPAHAPRVIEGSPALRGARFGEEGAHVSIANRGLCVGLAAIGREGAMRAVGSRAPKIAGPEVRIARGDGVLEWWRSLPSGLEQGVTIAERPAGRGPLRLEMAVAGARPELVTADAIALRGEDGAIVSRYAHVVALDARGRRVPARLAAAGARIRIEVDDDDARYPLVVDPLLSVTEEALLLGEDPEGSDFFGRAVAIAGDGTRAIVGMPNEDLGAASNAGSAYVFVRSGATWTREATLLPPSPFSQGIFGTAVAMTADGSRAIVGAPQDDTRATNAGSAIVFVRSGTAWSVEQALFAPDAAADDDFGRAVAIDADGTRAIIGVPKDEGSGPVNAGGAHVFARAGATWTAEAALTVSGGTNSDGLGSAVAISADGTRALVGAEAYDDPTHTNVGNTQVFVRSGTAWSLEATLLASDRATGDLFGSAVALDAVGTRALIGVRSDDVAGVFNAGSARVFVRSGSTWTEEATLLAAGGADSDSFGFSVALSSDGLRALVAAPSVGMDRGRAYVFELASGAWTEAARIDAAGGDIGDRHGSAVALTSDGSRALVGADGDNDGIIGDVGSARVFTLAAAAVDGEPCTSGGECASGFCSDGVCCATDCGDDTTDCRACSALAGGTADGTCTPLSDTVAPTVECRPSAGACDRAERCEPTGTECPLDALEPADLVCHPASACELAETCDGTSAACPAGGRAAPAGTVCRAASDLCDAEERCDGTSTACPSDALRGAGEQCRPSTNVCDPLDLCSGGSADCPDVQSPADSACEIAGMAGVCRDGVCCTRSCGECEVCSGGGCAPVADGEACSAQCGAEGTCRAGACVAECPDTGTTDAGARPRVYASGCKCGVTGGRAPAWMLGVLAPLALLRIARRRSARRRRTARS